MGHYEIIYTCQAEALIKRNFKLFSNDIAEP